jgi:hypothetical protein
MTSAARNLDDQISQRLDENAVHNDSTNSISKGIHVLCRKTLSSDAVEIVRAYDDEIRAQADLDFAQSVSDDEFWISTVPFLELKR